MHFLTLGNASHEFLDPYIQKGWGVQEAAPALWPIPEGNFADLMKPMTSFMFVRNPMGRIVSAYFDKIIRSPSGWENKEIISRRGNANKTTTYFDAEFACSPTEFIEYILDDVKTSSTPNQHWNLQLTSCPICSADFKIIGKMEEIHEDTMFIMHKANLSHLINDNLNGNTSEDIGPRKNKEQLFWANVTIAIIEDVFQTYKLDFDTFEYDLVQYFKDIGFDEMAEVFKNYNFSL